MLCADSQQYTFCSVAQREAIPPLAQPLTTTTTLQNAGGSGGGGVFTVQTVSSLVSPRATRPFELGSSEEPCCAARLGDTCTHTAHTTHTHTYNTHTQRHCA